MVKLKENQPSCGKTKRNPQENQPSWGKTESVHLVLPNLLLFFPRKLLTNHLFIPRIDLFLFLHQNKEGKKGDSEGGRE